MREHLGESINVPDICLNLGISRRELEYSFRSVFDQSPREYLQTLRLNAIRRKLRSSGGSIIDVAFEHGINHLGRFSADYRALFGEYPSATRAK
ncbi:MAG: helix-turn-helix domain-containing protein [Nibricoccus sp.]